jgi:hypothetical protein
MPKVMVSLRSIFFKMAEFINFRHFSSFLILDHLLLRVPSKLFFSFFENEMLIWRKLKRKELKSIWL